MPRIFRYLRRPVHFVSEILTPRSPQAENDTEPSEADSHSEGRSADHDVVVKSRLSVPLLREYVPELFAHREAAESSESSSVAVLLCGPPSFNQSMASGLAALGISGSVDDDQAYAVVVLE